MIADSLDGGFVSRSWGNCAQLPAAPGSVCPGQGRIRLSKLRQMALCLNLLRLPQIKWPGERTLVPGRPGCTCPFPSNLRQFHACRAGVPQIGGTESGRVCPIELRQIAASLAIDRGERAGQSIGHGDLPQIGGTADLMPQIGGTCLTFDGNGQHWSIPPDWRAVPPSQNWSGHLA